MASEAVEIVRFSKDGFWGDNRFSMDTEGLEAVVNRPEICDLPIAILSILGSHRTGKSFLLNYLMRYLQNQERDTSDSWLDENTAPLHGFQWNHGVNRSTDGIMLWKKPFIVRQHTGQKVAVLLMDTQGIFDGTMDSADTAVLCALSTSISTIQVLNVLREVDEAILKRFEVYMESASILVSLACGGGNGPNLQRLVLLIRDWMDPAKYPYGEHGGYNYLQEVLQYGIQREMAKDHPVEHITKHFDQVDCFLMPIPGNCLDRNGAMSHSNSDGDVSQLSSEFKSNLQTLGPFLFHSDNIHIKKIACKHVTGKEILDLCKRYIGVVHSGKISSPINQKKVMIKVFNGRVWKFTVHRHEKQLIAIYENMKKGDILPKVEELELKIANQEHTSKDYFLNTIRDPDDDIQRLYSELEKVFEKTKSECLIKLKKDITSQRTNTQ